MAELALEKPLGALWLSRVMAAMAERKENSKALKHHDCIVSNVPQLILAVPGEQVKLELLYQIWNNDDDSCMHQRVLLLDLEPICEMYDGVPSSCEVGRAQVTFMAPTTPGLYVLWQSGQLQYTMQDALKNIRETSASTRESLAVNLIERPGDFVGFVKVSLKTKEDGDCDTRIPELEPEEAAQNDKVAAHQEGRIEAMAPFCFQCHQTVPDHHPSLSSVACVFLPHTGQVGPDQRT
jgi:hypothetical protein